MTTLGVMIITQNEALNIKRCLEAVCWADEIVIVDSGSTDETLNIAKQYPQVKIFHQPWLGFGPQKQKALSYITSDWVLSIDADEEVTPELKEEIQDALSSNQPHDLFFINRKNFYCGIPVRFVWRDNKILRLFRKGYATVNDKIIHEKIEPTQDNSSIGQLKTKMNHFSIHSRTQFIKKMNHYSSLKAQQNALNKKKIIFPLTIIKPLLVFIKFYIIKLGFLDGRVGFEICVMNFFGKIIEEVKINDFK